MKFLKDRKKMSSNTELELSLKTKDRINLWQLL